MYIKTKRITTSAILNIVNSKITVLRLDSHSQLFPLHLQTLLSQTREQWRDLNEACGGLP